jgi:NADPH:quinone reductase-like Zn-dependent oxidoreductase
MRKVVVHAAGGYEELRVETHPDPEPGVGEVVVRTSHAGVNYADGIVRMGLYASAKEYVGWPITPGFEVAGVVAAVGPNVDRVRVGEAVFAVTRFGGYATHVVVPERQVFALPHAMTPAEAAAFPSVHMTAWYALAELAHPRPGSTVLVHSAAGGVGSALVQIAKILGCRVIGVVGSSHKVEAVRALGADEVIDKSSERLWERASALAPSGYDVVLDANGVETLRKSYAHLAPGGRLVVYGFHSMFARGRGTPKWTKLAVDFVRTPRFDPLEMTNANKSVLAFNLSYLFERTDLLAEGMSTLLRWRAAGKLAPPALTTFPLDRVADAHRAIESGQTVGKLVLDTTEML